jgi:hypothetical protein
MQVQHLQLVEGAQQCATCAAATVALLDACCRSAGHCLFLTCVCSECAGRLGRRLGGPVLGWQVGQGVGVHVLVECFLKATRWFTATGWQAGDADVRSWAGLSCIAIQVQ